MNMNNKKLITLSLSVCLLVTGAEFAKVKNVTSRRSFEQAIAKDSMVVALFYDENNKDVTQMYEDVSKVQKYDDADVVFLRVNAARPQLRKLAELYDITTMPMFIFFHDGKRLDKQVLRGDVSRDMLESAIDKNYGMEIEQYVEQKDARNERRLTEEKKSWKPYWYPRDIFVNSYGPEERNLE